MSHPNSTPEPRARHTRKIVYVGSEPPRHSRGSSSVSTARRDETTYIPNPTTSESYPGVRHAVDASSNASSASTLVEVNKSSSFPKPLKRKRAEGPGDAFTMIRGRNVKQPRFADLITEEDVIMRDSSPEIQFLGSSPNHLDYVQPEAPHQDEVVTPEFKTPAETPTTISDGVSSLSAPSSVTQLKSPQVIADSTLTTPAPDSQEEREGSSASGIKAEVEEEKKVFIIKSEVSKKEEIVDSHHALSIDIPTGSTFGVPRKFFMDVYGVHGVHLATKIVRNNGTRPTLAPTLERNPFIPSGPGKPGKIYGGRSECLGTFTVLVPVKGSNPALWQYAGEYRASIKGALTPEQFRNETKKVILSFNLRLYPLGLY
ncbi:hypothetical protein D9758_018715 [Tetrapyrgos nigripes]|uniref:DUF6697 domain-containing protein n=1 Tax=Tetrapyrgos nigripes TaxID=182062 RepID=A0A8H5EVS6_9AGAR|nr:hypothetical protein D9758_018715 [Tetrapyrgos nigripes]